MRKNSRTTEGEHLIGTFEVTSGKLVVTDPCYTKGTHCAAVLDNVKNGTWVGKVHINDERSWGARVAEVRAYAKGFSSGAESRMDVNLGVDSGQLGIFDHDSYPNGECGEYGDMGTFYGRACEQTCPQDEKAESIGAGIVDGMGINSSSGFGDGSYRGYVWYDRDHKTVVGVRVVFIPEETNCESCGEYCDGEDMVDGDCPNCRGMTRCDDCGGFFKIHQMNDAMTHCLQCAPDEEEEDEV